MNTDVTENDMTSDDSASDDSASETHREDGSDNRPVVYTEGSKVIYRASAVGGSAHVLAAARAGIDPLPFPKHTLQYMSEGNLHEEAIISRVAADGWLMEHTGPGAQMEVDVPVSSNISIRVHPDGLATATRDHNGISRGNRAVVEAKAMSQDVFATFDRRGFGDFYRYAVQLSIQMHGCDLPGLFAIKNRNSGDVRWQVLTSPPVPWLEVRKRVLFIDKMARDGNLNPYDEKCSSYPCQYYFLHDATEPSLRVDDERLDLLADMLHGARQRRKTAEEVERSARERLMQALQTDRIQTARWSIARVTTERKNLDRKRLAAEVDLSKYETVTEVTQLRVTERGKQ